MSKKLPTEYRPLVRNQDHIQMGDEFQGLGGKTWGKFQKGCHIGNLYTDAYVPCRRPISKGKKA